MWPNSITGKRMCTKKWLLLIPTDEAVGVKVPVTGDSPKTMEIFLSHCRKVESEKKGFRRSGFTPKTERYGRTSYVASVGTCQVIPKPAGIGFQQKPHTGGFWRPFVC